MHDIIPTFKSQTEELVSKLQAELKGIRTGRAHTGMIEGLQVEAYGGTKMRLIELASITTESNDALVITPFDPSTVSDIEKGILASPLGLSPNTQGSRIVVRVPPLSEEQRVKFVKLVSQLVEETRNKVRYERDSIRKKIKQLEDAKELTEDDTYRLEKEVDAMTGKINNELQTVKESKEQEIMEV
ncbi:ribosome recycling factor [Candidatus Roizmanbacteria bacterium CG_4_9_14_0_2_um_filter_39_13]|uniref:Ribosome recycling factor n=1 Tax=Candidatus Roizmanbacteria bacterium CG_4_9_14_0_2_um_filter_39_13 TaxID=1974839 RepID=A0A2M8EYZ3_9BACT|nr:MAG: ribosome recycling factor [Candidatus Roizmanbacteria bacterium CG_4_10_14_0_2_um_filter_39_12]PJC31930.1 MAG: ribosome recycling factor [Candidatus Roizmanbacteria bacterium CG_4_9_14_0_2_um_filter_39_13]